MGIVIKYCVYLQLFFGRSPLLTVVGAWQGTHDIKKGVYLTLCSWHIRILQIHIEVKDEATVDVLCGICIFAIVV